MTPLVSPDMPSNYDGRTLAVGNILRWTVCVALVVGVSCQLPGGDVTKLSAQDANFADWLGNATTGVVLDPSPSANASNVALLTSLDTSIKLWTCSTTDKTFEFDKEAAETCQQELLDSSCLTCRVILGITVNLRSDFGFIPDDFLARAQKLPCLQKIEVKGSLAAGILASNILPDTKGVSTLCFDIRDALFDPTSACKGSELLAKPNCPSGIDVSLPSDASSISIRGQPKAKPWSKTKLTFAFPRPPRNLVNLHIEGTAFGGRLPSIPRTIKTVNIVKNQFSGLLPLSWTQGVKVDEVEIWEPKMASALDSHVDVLGRMSSLRELGMCFENFGAGGEREAQKRLISKSSKGSVSKMCGLDVKADRRNIKLCSAAFDRVAHCSLDEEQNFLEWSEGLGIYEKMSFTLHDDPGITEKSKICKTLPEDLELEYDKAAIDRCDRVAKKECPECSRIAGISLNLNGGLSKGVDVEEFLEEIGSLPCLQKLELRGDFSEVVLFSPLLETATRPTILCFDVRHTILDVSSGCKKKSCSEVSDIAFSNSTKIISIVGQPSSQPWSNLTKNRPLFTLPESIQHLHIEGTVFGGSLPDTLPEKLKTIDIALNQFSGFLPKNWTQSENLVELRVWEPGLADDIDTHVKVFEGLPSLEKIGLCPIEEQGVERIKSLVSDSLLALCDLDRDFVQICSTTFERIADCGGSVEKKFMKWAKSMNIFDNLELTLDGDDIVESNTTMQCSTFPHQMDAFYDEASQNRCKEDANVDCADCKRIVGVTFNEEAIDEILDEFDAEDFLKEMRKLPCLQKLEVKGTFAKSVLISPALQDAAFLDTLCLDLGETFTDFSTPVPCDRIGTRRLPCLAPPNITLPDTLRKLSISGAPSTQDRKKANRESTSPLFDLPASLQQLHLEGTTFGGVLPGTLPEELTHVVLTKNLFSGGMPSGWGATVGLTQLHVWEPGMERELQPSAEILMKLPDIEGIGLCFDEAKLKNGEAISNSVTEVSAVCSLDFRLDPEDFQICSAKFDRVLYCSGPEEARFWRYSQRVDIYRHLSFTMHDAANIQTKRMACSTFPDAFLLRYDRRRMDECQAKTEASCPWCSRILAIDLTGEIDPREQLDEKKFVEEIGRLPCLQKLELRGEFGRRILTAPSAKKLSNLAVICADVQDTPLDPHASTPASAKKTTIQELNLPSNLRTLSIRGSQPFHDWSRSNTTFPLFRLPKSLQHLHLEGTAYGGLLPKKLPRNLANLFLVKNQFDGLLPAGVVDGLSSSDFEMNIWEPGMENRLPNSFARVRWGDLGFRWPSLSLCFEEMPTNGSGHLLANSPKASVAVLCDPGLRPKICSSRVDILRDCGKAFSDREADFIEYLHKQMDEGHLGSVSVGAISKTNEAVFTDVCRGGRCFRSFHSTNYTGEDLSRCQKVFDFEESNCPRCKRITDVQIGQTAGSFPLEELTRLMGALPCLFRLTLTPNSTEGLKSSLELLQNIDTLRVEGSGKGTARNYEFPELPSNLRRLYVMDTGYGGSLPNLLPPRLQTLQIQNNWFTGPLPSSISRNLRKIHFLDNQFTGSVPQGWCRATRLRELSISEPKMDPAPLPECLELINLRLLNVCFKDSGKRLPETLRLELCSAGGLYCQRTLRDCLDDYAMEILLTVWIPFAFFALVILPILPVVLSKFLTGGTSRGGGGSQLQEWCNWIMEHWAFQWFTKGFLLVFLYLWDIGTDLYVIGVLWGRIAAYIMAAVVAMHFILAFGFFGRKVWKAGLETRKIDASIKVPDKIFDRVFLHWAHRGSKFVRVLKVILVSAPGTIAFDTFGLVSRLTGSRLECISSKFDFYAHFESRALTESIVEAPLEAIFQSIVFGIGTNDTLNFGISRRTFLISILGGMFSMTKALVLLRYRSWEYGVSFWVILYKEATGTMHSLEGLKRGVKEGYSAKGGSDDSETSDRRIIDHADSCDPEVLEAHAGSSNKGVMQIDKT
ncbi:hypothetical protein BSKO_13186 [Bryopsis sp. KO-2023]|nr:hypothetical protein BSKO_13186 [Bryopsis sp. KO-2023]